MSNERESNAINSTVHEKSLITRMLEGAAMIGFLSLFTMFDRSARATLPLESRVMGLILASLGGAVGGIAYYASDPWRARGGIFKTVANVASILAYCAAAVLFIGVWILLGDGPHP
jgi:uncharacterized membrane-anchored protein